MLQVLNDYEDLVTSLSTIDTRVREEEFLPDITIAQTVENEIMDIKNSLKQLTDVNFTSLPRQEYEAVNNAIAIILISVETINQKLTPTLSELTKELTTLEQNEVILHEEEHLHNFKMIKYAIHNCQLNLRLFLSSFSEYLAISKNILGKRKLESQSLKNY